MSAMSEQIKALYAEYRGVAYSPEEASKLVLAHQLAEVASSISDVARALNDTCICQGMEELGEAVKKAGMEVENGLMQVGIAIHQHR